MGVKVTNGLGQVDVAYASITVAASNQPPTIAAPVPSDTFLTVNPGTSISFAATIGDAENDLISYRWLYDGSPVSTGTIYTHLFDNTEAGAHAVVLAVSDPGGTRQQEWDVLVAPTLSSLALTPANASIPKGSTQQFTATGTYSNATTADYTHLVTWSSNATSVATVDANGLATGIGAGTATILAGIGAIVGTTQLTVTLPPPTLVSIAIAPANPSITRGATQQFTATGTYSDNSTADITAGVTWSADTASVATINASGLAKGVGAGSSKITAASGSVSASTTLTIIPPALISIAVSPTNPSVAKGLTQQFTAMGTYADSSTADITASVTWAAATPSVAAIDASGLARGVGVGTSQITATSGSVSGSATLMVGPAMLTSIGITPGNIGLQKGSTLQLAATGTFSDSSTTDLTASVTWSSSNTPLVTVSAGGLITAVAQGSATIAASKGGVTGTTGISVSNYVAANGYAASDFAIGFASSSSIGPVGLVFDQSGNLYVVNYATGFLYKFGPQGGVASPATQVNATPLNVRAAGLAFDKNGHLYLAQQGTGNVVELNPADGTIIRTVATGLSLPTGLATDPVSGDLFVSDQGSGTIDRISNFASGPGTVKTYAAALADGLTFAPDGTLYAALPPAEIVRITGTDSASPGVVTAIASVSTSDGIAISANPQQPFLLVNRNDGNITKIDLSATPPTLTGIFSGGTRGDFIAVGPDGCIYATQTDRVVKVTNADGTCSLAPTTPVNQPPILHLPGNQSVAQGSALSFQVTATDPEATDLVTLGASGLPGGLGFTDSGNRTGTVTGTVTAAPGEYAVTFAANDGFNPAVTRQVTITVTANLCATDTTPPGFNFTRISVPDPSHPGTTIAAVQVTIADPAPSSGLKNIQASGSNLQLVDPTTGKPIAPLPAGWTSARLTASLQTVVSFTTGATTTYTFVAAKVDPSQPATITVQSVDQCGNVGDPPFRLHGRGLQGSRSADRKKVQVTME